MTTSTKAPSHRPSRLTMAVSNSKGRRLRITSYRPTTLPESIRLAERVMTSALSGFSDSLNSLVSVDSVASVDSKLWTTTRPALSTMRRDSGKSVSVWSLISSCSRGSSNCQNAGLALISREMSVAPYFASSCMAARLDCSARIKNPSGKESATTPATAPASLVVMRISLESMVVMQTVFQLPGTRE